MLPTTMNIPLGRNAKFGTLAVELEKLPWEVKDYVFEYGLRQVLNDAMATKTDDDGNTLSDDEIKAKAVKRLDNLYAGTLRARGMGESEPSDPFEAECYKLAISDIMAIYTKADKFKGLPKGTKDKLMFVVNKERAAKGLAATTRDALVAYWLNTHPRVAEVAQENLDRRAKDSDDTLALAGMA